MDGIRTTFPYVFEGRRRNKPHSQSYRDFKEKWGIIDTVYEIADEKIEKIGEIYQIYVNDFLQYLTYMIQKQEMQQDEDSFQEQLRKAKRGK